MLGRTSSLLRTSSSPRRFWLSARFRQMSTNKMAESRPAFSEHTSIVTEPPNPSWKLGDGSKAVSPAIQQWKEDEKAGWKTFDLQEMESKYIYPLLTSAIVPRPVAFVSSLDADGTPNLAPFSYFSMVSHNPPMLSVSFTLSPRKQKDTYENIKAIKGFTVNIISEAYVEAANAASVEAPMEVDEWVVAGLTREPSAFVKPPRVRESAVSFECELYTAQDIKPEDSDRATAAFVLGRIRAVHVRKSLLTDKDLVDPTLLKPIARLGGILYTRLGDFFEIPRLRWDDVKDEVADLESGKPQNAKI